MSRKLLFFLLVFSVILVPVNTACECGLIDRAPYDTPQYEEIKSSETAFLVPLEGATKADQAKLNSIEFLEGAKVAEKRVRIPTRMEQTTRCQAQSRQVHTMRVIKVDRAPVAREWTKSTETGTSISNQAFKVESSESIDFWVGGVAAGSIREPDASKFLYFFSGASLAQVMDSNVRNMIQKLLFEEFGIRPLEEGKVAKKEIFVYVERQVKEAFAPLGLTVEYVGGSEGLTYNDPKVQDAINLNFQAQQEKIRAAAEYEAQQKRNELNVEKARAEAQAEIERGRGAAERDRQRGEILARYPQLTQQTVAEKWDGKRPQVEMGGGQGTNILLPLPGSQLNPQPR